jgi:hypothetical protein
MSEKSEPSQKKLNSVDARVLGGDDKLSDTNDTCTASFEVPGYVSFHFKPAVRPGKDMSLVVKEFRNYRGALKELARRLKVARETNSSSNKYAFVHYVAVTSWIIENNEPILAQSGFRDDPMMPVPERAELVRVYKERQEKDGVLPEHKDIEPKCLRVTVDEFIKRHIKPS